MQTEMTKLNETRLWTALVTPFNEDLTVDYASLRSLILEQEAANNGLLILGSTGEALNIDLESRKEIITTVLTWKPKVPVMIGVGGHDLKATREWLTFLNELPEQLDYDCLLMVTPLYAKPGHFGQLEWFNSLLELAEKPVMLYNVPGRTGCQLDMEAVAKLATHEKVWAIKEASGSVERFCQYRDNMQGKPVYCGDDGLFFEFAAEKSHGLISVASNVWPKATHEYVTQCVEGRFDAPELWQNASNSMFQASNPVPAKKLLTHQKRITTDVMMPPLSARDLASCDEQVKWDTEITKWFEAQK